MCGMDRGTGYVGPVAKAKTEHETFAVCCVKFLMATGPLKTRKLIWAMSLGLKTLFVGNAEVLMRSFHAILLALMIRIDSSRK